MSELVIAFVAVVIVLVVASYGFAIWMFPRQIREEDWAQDADYRPLDQRYRNVEGQ